jgi:hypothetical protein
MSTLPFDLNIQDSFCRHKWLQIISILVSKSIFVDINGYAAIQPKHPRQFLSTLMATLSFGLNIQDTFCWHKWLQIISILVSKSIFVDINVYAVIRP